MLGVLVGTIGCGGGATPPPRTILVTGVVTFAGQPLNKGTVTLQPLDTGDKSLSRPAIGQIQSDGTFKLGTFKDGDGALPGEYAVLIASYENEPTAEEYDAGVKRKSAIPEKYSNAISSGIVASVPKEGKDSMELKFELTK